MSAFVELVVMNEFGIRPLRPASRCWAEVIRESAHGNRDGDAFRGKEGHLVFPVQTGGRDPRIRQPIVRDVVEHVVPCEALGPTVEDTRDELEAACVMVEDPCGQADRGIRDPVQRLGTGRHFQRVGQVVLVEEGELVIRLPFLG